MTRVLKTSGFLGLAVMMCVGLYQSYLLSTGEGLPPWLVGGHAHLGVLSILAIVLGFAVPAVGLTGTLRRAVTGAYVAGQWGLPLTVWIAAGAGIGILHLTTYLWGALLIVSMLIMAWHAATAPDATSTGYDRGAGSPADD